jgi:hypothetical protein
MNYKDQVMLILLMLLILPLSLFYRVQIKISHPMMILRFFPLLAQISVKIFLPMASIPELLLLAQNLLAPIPVLSADPPRAGLLQRDSRCCPRPCLARAGELRLAGPPLWLCRPPPLLRLDRLWPILRAMLHTRD